MNDQSTIPPSDNGGAYQVLARKYRPGDFSELVGQDALVRTLSNAIRENRIAHAFILTGVRGVGKTTTARIIARTLNCVGPDGSGGPTVTPCGVCEYCVGIAESRHVDVLEMDAASRTGVDNMRELLDGVRYRPISARYKVYIIDEVHMLSTQAFNALLKTLEEPPEHVIFVFATTEIRKVPVTVLSRCQRFDLRRIAADQLIDHFSAILAKEDVSAEEEALGLIANAAEGSVRDGLSLLDQAIAHGAGKVTTQTTRDMLGLADRGRVFDLFEAVVRGDVPAALTQLGEQYDLGAEPAVILRDMLDLTHWLTRLKVVPEAAHRPDVSQTERERGKALSDTLAIPVLARTWQALLKGLSEVQTAPSAIAAAEMVLVRLAYLSAMPPPADLIKQLQDGEVPAAPANPGAGSAQPAPPAPSAAAPAVEATAVEAAALVAAPVPGPESENTQPQAIADFDTLVALAHARDPRLYHDLIENVRLISCQSPHLAIQPTEAAPLDLAQRLSQRLEEWSGERWMVSVEVGAEGAPPLAEQRRAADEKRRRDSERHPLVQAVIETFPGAEIVDVRPLDLNSEAEENDTE
jgi:DNA polymerase-3 subunit gamma/tau